MGAGPISRQTLVAKLRSFGYEGPRQGGNHSFMVKGKLKLTIPNKHAHEISGQLVDKILNQAEIGLEEWNQS